MSENRLKFTYFNLRGRGEVLRLLFAAAKQPLEENTVDMEKEWPSWKPKMKHAVVPELEVDGVAYSQSLAINTFVARKFGFFGTSEIESLQIDEIQHLREDLLTAEASCHFESNQAAKDNKQKQLIDELYPRYLGFFNDIIKKNGTGFAVGKKLSLADITIFEGFTSLSLKEPSLIEKYPQVSALREKVADTDGIKEYLGRRVVTVL